MDYSQLINYIPIFGILALIFALIKSSWISKRDPGNDTMKEIAGHITPVPKGVGPMTIAMLLKNTLSSAQRSQA